MRDRASSLFFFFNDTATTEIYTLSLHDALPISHSVVPAIMSKDFGLLTSSLSQSLSLDRKSTRLNSSHGYISYAVFCLKKKKKHAKTTAPTTSTYDKRMAYNDRASADTASTKMY